MANDLHEFEPIFGEAIPEWKNPPKQSPPILNPFLFRVFSPDPTHLTFHVSDFRSYTWESRPSIHQLDDLRDSIGISGSWSDFVNYVVSSLKSKDVKLLMEWHSNSKGAGSAKLVARKSKGMPLFSISLSKLVDSAASEVMANLSLELFKVYNVLRDSLGSEQNRSSQLTQAISAEKDKSLTTKRKFDAATNMENQRFQKTSDIGNDTSSITTSEKQPATEVQPTKAARRVVPAFRRAKVRGAVLHEADEEEDSLMLRSSTSCYHDV